MNDQELLREISKKLDILVSLGLREAKDTSTQDKIGYLSRFGLTVAEIATIVGTTAGTVAVARNRIKKTSK